MMEGGEEVMCFMFRLNYFDAENYYSELLKYCLKYSDSFSVISSIKKPYSKIPPTCEHDGVFQQWGSCLTKQTIGVKKWPGTETKDNHKVLNLYNSRKFRTTFLDLPNLFSPIENKLPEDICFYRDNYAWFATVSHEKIAFLYSATKEDLDFLKQMGIRYVKSN